MDNRVIKQLLFQSTPPHGERLYLLDKLSPYPMVSIHAPARGATVGLAALVA